MNKLILFSLMFCMSGMIYGQNQAPDANNDFITMPENGDSTFHVQANDSDPDGDALTTSIISLPLYGNAWVINDSIRYQPAPGYFGKDTLYYEVCDAGSLCDQAMVVFTMPQSNHGAAAHNDTAWTLEEDAVYIDVQANDYDPDGDSLHTFLLSQPLHGTVTVVNQDSILYTPDPGYVGMDQFLYEVCEPYNICDQASVTIEVRPAKPLAIDDYIQLLENTDIKFDIRDNDSDPNNDVLTGAILNLPVHGNAWVINDSIKYQPAAGYYGKDTIYCEVCNTLNKCDQSMVVLTVLEDNHSPAAFNDAATTLENTIVTIDVQANDYDPDATALVTSIFSTPSNGTVSINGIHIDYMPNPGFVGTDQFLYQVCDPSGFCDYASVTVTVESADNPPVAIHDFYDLNENTSINVNLLLNDSDPDGDPLTASALTGPNHGIAVMNSSTDLYYEPDAGYFGNDTLFYEICDPNLNCDQAMVVFNVIQVNHSPAAFNDFVTTWENTAVIIDIQANDYDPDQDSLITNLIVMPLNGTVTIVNNDSIAYTPNANFVGSDELVYQVCDIFGACDQASVSISVEEGVGVEENSNENSINVYPNPNDGEFFINFNFEADEDVQINIVSTLGKLVMSENISNIKSTILPINISEQSAGYYFITIKTEDDTITKRISVK